MKRTIVGRASGGRYVPLVETREDQKESFAAMLAARQAPGTKGTDRALLQGWYNNRQFDAMPKVMAEKYLSMAREAGINPHGKVYMPGLADHRKGGDPAAWISCGAGATSEVLEVCRRRNLGCTGAVEHRMVETPPEAPVLLAEDIVRREMKKEIAKEPGKKHDLRELREKVIDRCTPARRKKR